MLANCSFLLNYHCNSKLTQLTLNHNYYIIATAIRILFNDKNILNSNFYCIKLNLTETHLSCIL